MDSRDTHSMHPAPSYPSPNSAQMGSGTIPYYNTNQRQLTADELRLSAELSRENSTAHTADATNNGVSHGQQMVLGPASASGGPDMGRPSSADQHQQQHMLQFTPNQQTGVHPNHDLSFGDDSARRKRSKISRACDECRRKKTRCDASSSSGVETCSNCQRTNVICQFSRVPLKRGPNKGYIKELGERLVALEREKQEREERGRASSQSAMHYPMTDGTSPRGFPEFSPAGENSLLGRKRTYSMTDNNAFAHGLPTATEADASAIGDMTSSSPQFTNTPMKQVQPFWTYEGAQELIQYANADVETPVIDVDEKALDAYYSQTHDILPILPFNRKNLNRLLQQCSRGLQETFVQTLYSFTGADVERIGSVCEQVHSFTEAQNVVMGCVREDFAARTFAQNLVYWQILLLMVLEADIRGPDNLLNRDGIPKGTLIQFAVELGRGLGQEYAEHDFGDDDGTLKDVDNDYLIAQRDWLVTQTLDHWHSVSVGRNTLIENPQYWDVNLEADLFDQKQAAVLVSRYSAHLFDTTLFIKKGNELNKSVSFNDGLRKMWNNHLHQLKKMETTAINTKPEDPTIPIIKTVGPLMFNTIDLLEKRLFTAREPATELWLSLHKVLELLDSNPHPTPFTIHALVVATITLLEFLELPEYAEKTRESLNTVIGIVYRRGKQMTEANEFESPFATPIWDEKLGKMVQKRMEVYDGKLSHAQNQPEQVQDESSVERSLQHLAEIAVGAGAGVATSSSPPATTGGPDDKDTAMDLGPTITSPRVSSVHVLDFTRLVAAGYFNVLARFVL